jgi:hypothetical protein
MHDGVADGLRDCKLDVGHLRLGDAVGDDEIGDRLAKERHGVRPCGDLPRGRRHATQAARPDRTATVAISDRSATRRLPFTIPSVTPDDRDEADRRADDRDRAAQARDREAAGRDLRAAIRDALAGDQSELGRADRRPAADDRWSAAEDRREAGVDRRAAAHDRQQRRDERRRDSA